MTLFIVALKTEALPLIEDFKLQKTESKFFTSYQNDDFVLIISGIGAIAASIAVSYACMRFKIGKIINFGIAASSDPAYKIGEIYIIDKIVDVCTHKVYHLPTMRSVAQAQIHTFPIPQGKKLSKVKLADMEASGFYEASVKFLPKEKILILKVVSDYMQERIPDPQQIRALVQRHLPLLRQLAQDY